MAHIELINGIEGMCIGINNMRIAGPKPWAGGRVIKSWDIDDNYIFEALGASQPAVKADAESRCGMCGKIRNKLYCYDHCDNLCRTA